MFISVSSGPASLNVPQLHMDWQQMVVMFQHSEEAQCDKVTVKDTNMSLCEFVRPLQASSWEWTMLLSEYHNKNDWHKLIFV